MTLLRLVPAAAFLVLAAAIASAMGAANFWESFDRITSDPWGVVTLVDLYAGFAVVSVIIALAEPRRAVAAAVILATPFLGSLVPAAWLVARLPMLAARLR